jgi:isopentenyldiphosphate isomerase
MAYPPVVIVDSKDAVIDWRPLSEAWEKRLIHRVVYVIVEDMHGRVLLHRRAAHMTIYPSAWDTVAGHVDVTPDYEESAHIELREEGGIDDARLAEVAYFYTEKPYRDGKRPKRFIKIFRTQHDGATVTPNDDEVAASRWFTKDEIKKMAAEHPEDLAFGLEVCLPYILGTHEDHSHQAAS